MIRINLVSRQAATPKAKRVPFAQVEMYTAERPYRWALIGFILVGTYVASLRFL